MQPAGKGRGCHLLLPAGAPRDTNKGNMADVEGTLERVKIQNVVESYVIANNTGVVLRRLPSMSQQEAEVRAGVRRVTSTRVEGGPSLAPPDAPPRPEPFRP